MARRDNTDKSVQVLVSAMIGALLVYFIGDAMPFEDGSATAQIVDIAPLILVALGLYGAFNSM